MFSLQWPNLHLVERLTAACTAFQRSSRYNRNVVQSDYSWLWSCHSRQQIELRRRVGKCCPTIGECP